MTRDDNAIKTDPESGEKYLHIITEGRLKVAPGHYLFTAIEGWVYLDGPRDKIHNILLITEQVDGTPDGMMITYNCAPWAASAREILRSVAQGKLLSLHRPYGRLAS